jgi:hypothetical protein
MPQKVAGLNRNGWQVKTGTPGRFIPEQVAGLNRNIQLVEQ